MHFQFRVFATLVFWIWAVAAPQTEEGVLFIETSRYEGGESFTSTIRFLGDRVRFEASRPDGQQLFIYRGDRQTMYLIDPAQQTYQEITRADLEAMAEQVSQAMAMMEEQLRNMPPEQRAMAERMMRGMMPNLPQSATAPMAYTRISTDERVGNWTCDRYEGRRAGEKVQEVCTTDWENLDLTAADFRIFQRLGEFFEALSSRFEFDLFEVGVDTDAPSVADGSRFPGFPVSRTGFADGEAVSFHEISEVSRQSFEDSLFEVPTGFARTASPLQAPN